MSNKQAYSRGELRKSVITLYKAIVILSIFVVIFSVVLLGVVPGKIAGIEDDSGARAMFGTTLVVAIYNLLSQLLLCYGFYFIDRRALRWHLRTNYVGFVLTAAISVFATIQLAQQNSYCKVQSESADSTEFQKDCQRILISFNASMTPLWISTAVLLMLVYVGSVGLDRLESEVEEFYFLQELEEQRISAQETREDLERLYREGLSPAKFALSEHLSTTATILPRIPGKTRGRKIAMVYEPYTAQDDPDNKKNVDLLRRLTRCQKDLNRIGANAILCPGNQELDRDKVMEQDNVLFICSPAFKAVVASPTPNPLHNTLKECFAKQQVDHEFIIPIIFDGKFGDSVPFNIAGTPDRTISTIIVIDMSADRMSAPEYDKKYAKAMANLAPLGLVPTIFFLKHDNDYRVSAGNLELQLQNIDADEDDAPPPKK